MDASQRRAAAVSLLVLCLVVQPLAGSFAVRSAALLPIAKANLYSLSAVPPPFEQAWPVGHDAAAWRRREAAALESPGLPAAVIPRSSWGELLLACHQGAEAVARALRSDAGQALVKAYPTLKKIALDLDTLREFITCVIAPEQETAIFFIDQAPHALARLRSIRFSHPGDARPFVKDEVIRRVTQAVNEHQIGIFQGFSRALTLVERQALFEEMMRWSAPLEAFLFKHGVQSPSDVEQAMSDLAEVRRALIAAHREYNRQVHERAPGYEEKPYAAAADQAEFFKRKLRLLKWLKRVMPRTLEWLGDSFVYSFVQEGARVDFRSNAEDPVRASQRQTVFERAVLGTNSQEKVFSLEQIAREMKIPYQEAFSLLLEVANAFDHWALLHAMGQWSAGNGAATIDLQAPAIPVWDARRYLYDWLKQEWPSFFSEGRFADPEKWNDFVAQALERGLPWSARPNENLQMEQVFELFVRQGRTRGTVIAATGLHSTKIEVLRHRILRALADKSAAFLLPVLSLDTEIGVLRFSDQATRKLRTAQVHNVEELMVRYPKEITVRNFGLKVVREIEDKFLHFNLLALARAILPDFHDENVAAPRRLMRGRLAAA